MAGLRGIVDQCFVLCSFHRVLTLLNHFIVQLATEEYSSL